MPVLQRRFRRLLELQGSPTAGAGPAPLSNVALLRALLAVYPLHEAHQKPAPCARPSLGPVRELSAALLAHPAGLLARVTALKAQMSARLPQCGYGTQAGQCAGHLCHAHCVRATTCAHQTAQRWQIGKCKETRHHLQEAAHYQCMPRLGLCSASTEHLESVRSLGRNHHY